MLAKEWFKVGMVAPGQSASGVRRMATVRLQARAGKGGGRTPYARVPVADTGAVPNPVSPS